MHVTTLMLFRHIIASDFGVQKPYFEASAIPYMHYHLLCSDVMSLFFNSLNDIQNFAIFSMIAVVYKEDY